MPQVYYGPHGENNSTYPSAGHANLGRFPLGHTLILPDGREYKFTLNDGTIEVAGNLYQGVAALAGHTNRPADVARAIGAIAISGNITTTIAAADIYTEGVIHVNDAVGEGYSYRIKRAMTAGDAHASAASTAALTVNLVAGESVQVALDTTSEVTFTRNRYHQTTIHLSPPTASLTGVSPGVAAADRFYWSQVKGYAAVLVRTAAAGVVLAGLPVQASIGSTTGAVEGAKRRLQLSSTGSVLTAGTNLRAAVLDQDGSDTGLGIVVSASVTQVYDVTGGIANNAPIVGMCIKANATTEFALIDLMIF